MNTAEEMREVFAALYEMMANSHDVSYMHTFGTVHKEMMEWMIQNKPELAAEWIEKLESIKWKNYLTRKEAEKIVAGMEPKAPWTREQWRQVMDQQGYDLEKETCYNKCALWVTMNMIMSDSSDTLADYVPEDRIFNFVHDLAVDKLTDQDGVFSVRKYFGL